MSSGGVNGGILVQARMGSTRFPGKVLAPLHGKPMLQWLLEGMEQTGLPVAVAMPEVSTEEPLWGWLQYEQDAGTMGFHPRLLLAQEAADEADVAGRLLTVAGLLGWDWFIRVCGDSPFLDPALVTDLIEAFDPDVNNEFSWRWGLPHGQQCQLFGTAWLATEYEQMGATEKEHVQPVDVDTDAADDTAPRFTVDTVADLHRLSTLAAAMTKPHYDYGWSGLVDLHREVFPDE